MGKEISFDSYDESFLQNLKNYIRQAQVQAAVSVNRELVLLYWQIGRAILLKQQQQQRKWGAKVVERLAKDLKAEFPDVRGFSRSNLSEKNGMALTKTVQLGLIALFVVLMGQLLLRVFGIYTPSFLEVAISGIGVLLFVGAAVVDFFVLPRTYRDDQYIPAALSMYLTYINLFVFILRFLIAINSRD